MEYSEVFIATRGGFSRTYSPYLWVEQHVGLFFFITHRPSAWHGLLIIMKYSHSVGNRPQTLCVDTGTATGPRGWPNEWKEHGNCDPRVVKCNNHQYWHFGASLSERLCSEAPPRRVRRAMKK